MSLSQILSEHYSLRKPSQFRQYCVKHKSYECLLVPSENQDHQQPIQQQVSQLRYSSRVQDATRAQNSNVLGKDNPKDSKRSSVKLEGKEAELLEEVACLLIEVQMTGRSALESAENGSKKDGKSKLANVDTTVDDDEASWHMVEDSCLDEDWQEVNGRKLKKEIRSIFGEMGWKFLYEAWAPANGYFGINKY